MKKISIFTIGTITALMFGITACGENVSNNLGGATRRNNSNAYDDYNYNGNSNATNGTTGWNGFDINRSNGVGYWDYNGITNGITNSIGNSNGNGNSNSNGNGNSNSNGSMGQNGMSNTYTTSVGSNTYQLPAYNSPNVAGTTNTVSASLDSSAIAD